MPRRIWSRAINLSCHIFEAEIQVSELFSTFSGNLANVRQIIVSFNVPIEYLPLDNTVNVR